MTMTEEEEEEGCDDGGTRGAGQRPASVRRGDEGKPFFRFLAFCVAMEDNTNQCVIEWRRVNAI